MFSKLPVSLTGFAATAVFYVLQVIPFTGIFLMMLAAPFWSIITVNAGFVFLTLEALGRPGYRVWLIAPLIYFSGYAGYAHLSHQEFARLDAEIKAFNAGKSVPFDAATNDLVIAKKARGLNAAAVTLVSRYNLDVAYDANRNFDTADHLAYRIGKASLCSEIRKDKDARAAFIHAGGVNVDGKLSKTICSIYGPEDPARPAVVASSKRTKLNGWLLPATIDTLTLRGVDGRSTEFKTGFAATLPWLPMPVMGCALNSGAPSWDCFQGFFRLPKKGLGAPGRYGTSNIPIVANALGLKKITNAQLHAKAVGTLPPALQANAGKRIDISIANLKRIIANPAERLTVHNIRGMKTRPDLWSDEIPAMTLTLERAFDGGHATRERAGILQDLLNQLSPAVYRPVGEKILSALIARPKLKSDFIRSDTLIRMGELGPAALPILEERLFIRKSRLNFGAVLGLCKIGSPAARLAEALSTAALAPKSRSGRDKLFAVYVTLLRFGRADLAENVRSESRLSKDRTAVKVSKLVTSASPSDVCISRNKWQKRLRKSSS